MRVNEAFAHELEQAGVRAIFTLIGDETAHFAAHAAARGVRLYTTRHETGTVGMADGYSRVTGDVGLAVVARGPGLTNALTSIVCATRAGSGVVVIAGDSSLAANRRTPEEAAAKDSGHKYVAQERLLEAAMVRSVTLRDPATAAADFAAILRRARDGGGTVVVNMPIDVMRAEAGDGPATVELPPVPDAREPDPGSISRLADLVESASRPVILAGRGARRAQAGDDLRALAAQAGALLSTSLLAKSYFAGDPFNVGVAGGLGTTLALELLGEADLLLAFGNSLNPMTTYGGKVFPNARVIQIDSQPGAFGRFEEPDDRVEGDARLTAIALIRELEARGHRATGYRTPEVAERIAGFRPADTVRDQGTDGALDPRLVMLEIDRVLPERRTIVVDSGRQLTFPSTYLSAPDAASYIFPHDGGALGGALGVGLGAAVAAPDRLTVVCAGDGGLMMSIADLDTAVRYRLPMVIVVTNNSGFAGAVVTLRNEGLPEDAARYANPSFEAVAKGFGADGMTVRRMDDLADLRGRLDDLHGPLVIDCKTTTDVVPEWVEFIERIHRAQAIV